MIKKYISRKEYQELWDKYQSNRRYESPPWSGIRYKLEKMTVGGQSGPGTKYTNELERMKDEYYNPKLPSFITMYTINGIEYIYPEKKIEFILKTRKDEEKKNE